MRRVKEGSMRKESTHNLINSGCKLGLKGRYLFSVSGVLLITGDVQMGEQPKVSLVAYVREIGERGWRGSKKSAKVDKQHQEKPSTTEPIMTASFTPSFTKDCSEDSELGIY